ncbi:MAG: NAD-dependent epimerase/dehydratase family protein [Candidatus Staskawiczbacteria bacterium]|nr:NAD-dependent epimerase/dehydratase family protein [Candidatus Staskawiczbacteria bacterium]
MDKIIEQDIKEITDSIKKIAQKLEGKTLLVTGGTGFIGSYILDAVSFLNENHFKKPCNLICLDNLIVGDEHRISRLLEKEYFKFIKHDISKPFEYADSIDFIIHAASIASPTFYRLHPIETIDANVLGTRNLLELGAEKKIKSFLYFSSSETYGDPIEGNIPTPETYKGNVSFTGPRACYDESKRLGETLCIAFFNQRNVPVKIARPFNVYGPGMRLDDKRVIPDFMNNVLHNEPIIMYSDGKDTRSFCYATDAIIGFFKILLSDFNGEPFNVGNDAEEISMIKLAETIKEISGNKIEIISRESKDKNYLKDNPHRRLPDLAKIKKLLNYEPKTDLKTGLKKSIDWYKLAYNL